MNWLALQRVIVIVIIFAIIMSIIVVVVAVVVDVVVVVVVAFVVVGVVTIIIIIIIRMHDTPVVVDVDIRGERRTAPPGTPLNVQEGCVGLRAGEVRWAAVRDRRVCSHDVATMSLFIH